MNYYTYLKTSLKEVFLQHSKSEFNKKKTSLYTNYLLYIRMDEQDL